MDDRGWPAGSHRPSCLAPHRLRLQRNARVSYSLLEWHISIHTSQLQLTSEWLCTQYGKLSLWRILCLIMLMRPGFPLLDSIVVSIPACHAGDRGSIPRRGAFASLNMSGVHQVPTNIHFKPPQASSPLGKCAKFSYGRKEFRAGPH